MLTWRKHDGTEVDTDDLPATVDHCKSLGWLLAAADVVKSPEGSGLDYAGDAEPIGKIRLLEPLTNPADLQLIEEACSDLMQK